MSQPLVTHLPFKAGLPPMGRYLRSLIKRRAFISEFARSELRGQNYGSVFGQLWLVINPLLLSGVYFLLIYVIGGSSDATAVVGELVPGESTALFLSHPAFGTPVKLNSSADFPRTPEESTAARAGRRPSLCCVVGGFGWGGDLSVCIGRGALL